MTRALSVLRTSAVLAASLFLVTACASGPGAAPEAPATPTPTPTSPSPTPAVEEPEEPAADPTCETIIPGQIVEAFEDVGWTARAEPFRAGEVEIPEGVQCIWGDFTTATDHVQIFGWAPITDQDASTAQKSLKAGGWRTETSPDGIIITESPETTVATDEDGYGLTYLFGDGWVKYADTKQGLLLVTWPAR